MAIDLEQFKANYDWRAAFVQSFEGGYRWYDDDNKDSPINHVVEVLAAVEGENDGPAWVAIALMDDHRYALVDASCDYTGWDCQAWGTVEHFQSLDAACSKMSLSTEQRERLEPQLRELEKSGRVTLDWNRAVDPTT